MKDVSSFKKLHGVSQNSRFRQGIYDEKITSKKYFGPRPIYYRSGLELEFMRRLDFNPNVLKWSSETIKIPYISKEYKDRKLIEKKRNYFPDFLVILKSGKVLLIEVKPITQVPLNENQMRMNPDVMKNHCKFSAAIQYCKQKNWEFRIITEDSVKSLLVD